MEQKGEFLKTESFRPVYKLDQHSLKDPIYKNDMFTKRNSLIKGKSLKF